jgi:hypothetical protein
VNGQPVASAAAPPSNANGASGYNIFSSTNESSLIENPNPSNWVIVPSGWSLQNLTIYGNQLIAAYNTQIQNGTSQSIATANIYSMLTSAYFTNGPMDIQRSYSNGNPVPAFQQAASISLGFVSQYIGISLFAPVVAGGLLNIATHYLQVLKVVGGDPTDISGFAGLNPTDDASLVQGADLADSNANSTPFFGPSLVFNPDGSLSATVASTNGTTSATATVDKSGNQVNQTIKTNKGSATTSEATLNPDGSSNSLNSPVVEITDSANNNLIFPLPQFSTKDPGAPPFDLGTDNSGNLTAIIPATDSTSALTVTLTTDFNGASQFSLSTANGSVTLTKAQIQSLNTNLITDGAVGGYIGGQLALFLADNNQFANLTTTTALSTAGQIIGQEIGAQILQGANLRVCR